MKNKHLFIILGCVLLLGSTAFVNFKTYDDEKNKEINLSVKYNKEENKIFNKIVNIVSIKNKIDKKEIKTQLKEYNQKIVDKVLEDIK